MGMFDAFLGKGGGGGYTKAQRTGLQRSAEIKKRRKEEERAFERRQEASKSKAALTERGMMEAGETRRAGMNVAGGIEQQRISNVGQMARQRLTGGQESEAATTKAIREANVKSMEHGRKLTLEEIEHKQAMELAKVKGKDILKALFSDSDKATPDETARGGLEGNQGEYTFAQFTGLNREEQTKYMTHMKGKDPKKYLDFARQYKLFAAPREESSDMDIGSGGRSIYQSNSGTYRNY